MGTATAGPMIGPRFLEPDDGAGVGEDVCESGFAEPALEVVVMRVLEPPVFSVRMDVIIEMDCCELLFEFVPF